MQLLKDMSDYLAKQLPELLGTGKDIFVDYQPDTPSEIVVLSEYYGSGPALGADNFSNRSVQVLVRAESVKTARLKIWKVFQQFNNPETRVIDIGTRMTMMYPRQTPFKLKIDAQGRVYFVFNMGVSTEFKIKEE